MASLIQTKSPKGGTKMNSLLFWREMERLLKKYALISLLMPVVVFSLRESPAGLNDFQWAEYNLPLLFFAYISCIAGVSWLHLLTEEAVLFWSKNGARIIRAIRPAKRAVPCRTSPVKNT